MATEAKFGFTEADMLETPLSFRDGLFAGRTVLVSGAGSGFGKAMAIVFARLGANLYLCGRKPEKLERTAELIAGLGREVETRALTIRDAEAVDEMVGAAFERFGGLDLQINNAGGQFAQDAIDFSVKGWNAVIDTNLNGTWYMMQAAAKRWRDRGQPGSIVNITASVDRGIPQMAHTAASRSAVNTLSKTVATEWAPYNIRVNCLGIGTIASSGFENYTDAGRETFKDSNPMKKVGDLWDVAETAVFVGGPTGKFMNGEIVHVDGGSRMWGDHWGAGRPAYFER